ncbi:hypothetical protein P691DRAFT_805333 [Macrolepiota fuliginosa MF-IS2]|uniref:Uncharacterized protein n=1 Tax=Macrolepiota fuliginosa MF-IS2 TaxID=1400762 RepID=A0A9P6BYZ1_9AGAR|nr:hypothetical protein P691DRAFT_805333 [Macrolepiota fuliginosa MF-IS2]
MVLAQLVAVSVGYNLFNLALVLHPQPVPEKKADNRVPPLVWASAFLALVTVAFSRFTDDRTFFPNLLTMHGLIILPLLSSQPFTSSRYSISLATVYFVIYTASLVIRLYTLRVAIAGLQGQDLNPLGFLMAAFDVFYSHPAQSSIGWDIIWTTVSFFVWVTQNPWPGHATFERLFIVFGAPLVSIGVVAPNNLLNRERARKKGLREVKEE